MEDKLKPLLRKEKPQGNNPKLAPSERTDLKVGHYKNKEVARSAGGRVCGKV